MKSFALAGLLGVSIFAQNEVSSEGPTLQVRSADFAKMTTATNWVRNREIKIDGEEVLQLTLTSTIEL